MKTNERFGASKFFFFRYFKLEKIGKKSTEREKINGKVEQYNLIGNY